MFRAWLRVFIFRHGFPCRTIHTIWTQSGTHVGTRKILTSGRNVYRHGRRTFCLQTSEHFARCQMNHRKHSNMVLTRVSMCLAAEEGALVLTSVPACVQIQCIVDMKPPAEKENPHPSSVRTLICFLNIIRSHYTNINKNFTFCLQ